MRLLVATCDAHPSGHEDDAPLFDALARRGIEPVIAIWDRARWERIDACLIRSTWDYTWRRDEFLAWAEGARVPLWNPSRILRWNSHKRYLAELAARGVPVVPTEIVAAGATARLDAAHEIVVKPCVSAGARDTYRLRPGDPRPTLDATREWMIQPYLPSVEAEGEHSLIFFDGEFSHAIRKHAQLVEPRPAEGGEPRLTPERDELEAARRVLAEVEPLLYARVDLARAADGKPLLMELEAFEPSLFFRAAPEAADRLASAIARRLGATA
jgi:glutathione synthase/RimK-type ligase-like ATP-grasp enzyme